MSRWKVQMGFTREELGVLLLAINSIPSDVEERFVKQGTPPNNLYRKIYDKLYEVINKNSIPQAVLIIADYQYKSAFVADQEINLVACLIELMAECEFA